MTKLKVNLGGQSVEAEKMDFTPVQDAWTTCRLIDGTLIKVKVVVQDIFKLPGVDPLTGIPNFLVRSSNVVSVEPPTPTNDIN